MNFLKCLKKELQSFTIPISFDESFFNKYAESHSRMIIFVLS